MEVIPSEFARMAGVSATAVSKKIKSKNLIVNSSQMLDADYFAMQEERWKNFCAQGTLF